MQEVLLSRKVYFLAGYVVFAARQLHALNVALGHFAYLHDLTPTYGPTTNTRGYRVFDSLLDFHQTDNEFDHSLYGFLCSMGRLKLRGRVRATDPRDMVYGILGITSLDGRFGVQRDYTMPPRFVFATTARALIASEGDLGILAMCDGIERGELERDSGGAGSRGLGGLPSWVPDWTLEQRDSMKPLVNIRFRSGAGIGVPHADHLMTWWDQLYTRGKIVSTVTYSFPGALDELVACNYTVWFEPAEYGVQSQRLRDISVASSKSSGMQVDHLRLLRAILYSRLEKHDIFRGMGGMEYADRVLALFSQAARRSSDMPMIHTNDDGTVTHDLDPVHRSRDRLLSNHARQAVCAHNVSVNVVCETENCPLNVSRDASQGALIPEHTVESDLYFDAFYCTTDRLLFTYGKVRAGNIVAVLHGRSYPVVLERRGGGLYRYVTGCYCEGAMGEDVVTWADNEAKDIALA